MAPTWCQMVPNGVNGPSSGVDCLESNLRAGSGGVTRVAPALTCARPRKLDTRPQEASAEARQRPRVRGWPPPTSSGDAPVAHRLTVPQRGRQPAAPRQGGFAPCCLGAPKQRLCVPTLRSGEGGDGVGPRYPVLSLSVPRLAGAQVPKVPVGRGSPPTDTLGLTKSVPAEAPHRVPPPVFSS